MPDNILLVIADDHGQWCTGAYGNSEVDTPAIDHVADTGVRMENAFCPAPVCSPARASLYTGRYASQHGIHDWIDMGGEYDGPHWLADERTLPELLGEAGYTTGMVGKWHCGQGAEQQLFDIAANKHTDDWDVPKYSLEYDRRIADRALEFLHTHGESEEPFFLVVSFTGTHSPWEGNPERHARRYRRGPFSDVPREPIYRFGRADVFGDPDDPAEARAQYYAAVTAIDELFGRLLDELEDRRLFEETLVAYTADHGYNCGHHGIWGKSNGTVPLNMLEETVRVPLVLGGHTDVFGGQVRPEFVDHCDTFQTLLSFAGVEPPEGRNYPGESYIGQVTRSDGSPDRRQVQFCEHAGVRMIRTESHKLVRQLSADRELLFDLDADPRESRNVIDDPAYEAVAATLREELTSEFEAHSDPEKQGYPTGNLPSYNDTPSWER